MIVVIDNYDSFTYNLVHFLGELGAKLKVFRNDAVAAQDVVSMNPDGIVLSPGPCTPNEAGICLDLITRTNGKIPVLGVCLGHQSIGQAYGGKVVRAPSLMHGKTSPIHHNGHGVFEGVENGFAATRYHSLTIAPDSIPDCLEETARTLDGVIMGLRHKSHPVHGVQFHPESIASQHGHALLDNFLKLARAWNQSRVPAA